MSASATFLDHLHLQTPHPAYGPLYSSVEPRLHFHSQHQLPPLSYHLSYLNLPAGPMMLPNFYVNKAPATEPVPAVWERSGKVTTNSRVVSVFLLRPVLQMQSREDEFKQFKLDAVLPEPLSQPPVEATAFCFL